MKTCVYLSYKGLGANLLHLSYCHEIAKKYGSITIITLCNNLEAALKDDPLIERVIFISEYHKRFIDVLKLRKLLNTFNFDRIFIYYPSIRIYLASILSNIKEVYSYPIFKKKNLHLIRAAKKFTEKCLGINNCPTETNFFIKKDKVDKINKSFDSKKFKIVIGAGSSGPTTKWSVDSFSSLINRLNDTGSYFFLFFADLMIKIYRIK